MWIKNSLNAIAGSYSQVFFSDNRRLAFCLVLASFCDPFTGLSGLLAVTFALIGSEILGLKSVYVLNGLYTYNVLLTGLAMGASYNPNSFFFLLLFLFSVLTLLLSVWLASFMGRYRLPFLSIPFIVAVWVLLLNARGFSNELLEFRTYASGSFFYSASLDKLSSYIETTCSFKVVILYFKSMGSIFFQSKAIAGVLISLGLLLSSRIAFMLSWLGFLSGYVFFRITGGHVPEETYLLTGFNYIFAAIALAGFYLIPSAGSMLFVLLTAPLVAFFHSALTGVFTMANLPVYSLPFSLAVIMLLSVLGNRVSVKKLHLVQYQLYSPEKNLYAFHTYLERFKKDTLVHVHLPFFGEWTVSQGHEGNQTHKEEWKYALDFVVTDEQLKTFKWPGKELGDFYCYSLPVLAPADGYVMTVVDEIEDNSIGGVNLKENWGNTVIIKHGEYLYSKISHAKKDSIKVRQGDYVKKGELIAQCGNSGRSPEPHIHFQLQATPYVGAHTINYPISYFITKKNGQFKFHSFEVPKEGDVLLRATPTTLIKEAFYFIPGMKLKFRVDKQGVFSEENWEVVTDAYNSTYIYCHRTGSKAFLSYNDTVFHFSGFTGNKKSLLYYFYLAAYKVLLSYFPGLEVNDKLPVETYRHFWLKPLQDIVAPFYIFMRPVYQSVFRDSKDTLFPSKIFIDSAVYMRSGKSPGSDMKFEIELFENKIRKITVNQSNVCLIAENIG